MASSLPQLTRRGLLAAGGAALVGVVGGCSAPTADDAVPTSTSTAPPPATPTPAAPTAASSSAAVPFHGARQAGIETPPALLQTFIGLDLRDRSPESLDAVLRLVSDDAARLTQGLPALGDTEPENAAHPARLTVTLGIARRTLIRVGRPDLVPPQLIDLPAFPTDRLEDEWGQTDLLVQIGSDDSLTLAHTVRMLTKDVSTLTRVAWVQPGFRSSVPGVPGGSTTRNLMGQVDGTINPTAGTSDYDDVVWIGEGAEHVADGTILVLRRIRMHLDTWDALDRATQETVMGRQVATGAPLGAQNETDPVPFDAVDDNGLPVIAADAHVRVAHAATQQERILRRPYSYDNGMSDGTNDMGLLFAAYMRDPATSFVPIQARIAEHDAFNRWNTTIGSAVYLLPSGASEGGYVGEGMLA